MSRKALNFWDVFLFPKCMESKEKAVSPKPKKSAFRE